MGPRTQLILHFEVILMNLNYIFQKKTTKKNIFYYLFEKTPYNKKPEKQKK